MLKNQDIEADVVIVGYGGAGATAAITAHDHGAKVIVLEKKSSGGGDTRLAGGSFINPTSMKAVDHIEVLCAGLTERKIIEKYVEGAMKNKEWIEQLGCETIIAAAVEGSYPPTMSGASAWWQNVAEAESITRLKLKGEGKWTGQMLWDTLADNIERRGITVMLDSPARELITNQAGEVIGAIVDREGKQISVKAKRAVILACGGFEYSEAMKQAFLPCYPFYALGAPGKTGDGIIMAQKVGAALWHMPIAEGYLGFKAAEYEAAFGIRMMGEKFIFVDRYGRRFTDETGLETHNAWRCASHFDPDCVCYPAIPAHAIFDEAARLKGPLYPGVNGYNRDYKWSSDNSIELAKGWIKQGKTIGELAKQISIDGTTLEKTLTKYNEYCRTGSDPDFGRSGKTLVPIDVAPFYTIELWPCLLNTLGGPRRDTEARVLDHNDKPIPRLYVAGELGSLWGMLYEGGGNIAECLVFGRIAGHNAATEEPW